MTQIDPQSAAELDPAEAFEGIRRELSLLHRAIEGLTAARENNPDYTATLGEIAETLEAAGEGLKRIERSPAVKMTPANVAQELIKASAAVRSEDRQALQAAQTALQRSIGHVDGIVKRGQAADRQRDKLIQAVTGGVFAGILLWSFLPGVIARALPQSWHVPEWMAARTLRMEQREAGERMIGTAQAENVSAS
jgi:Family of unknown function (DUF6118)